MAQDPNLVRGSLDLLILKSLTWGPLHGYGVSEWIGLVTSGQLLPEEGTLYPALHRLKAKKWVEAEWGVSENNRRAKYYQLTAGGRAHLESESARWLGYTEAVSRALALKRPES